MSKLGVRNSQGRGRIERLESLLKRVLAGAAAASLNFAGPVVANEAAAAAFPLTDVPGGVMQVFVLTHRSIWTKRNGVAGTQGVPPLFPHEVIATTAGPVGVLCRTTYSDPALRIGINDIFIDPANVNASDENSGLTALLPLKTGYELFRRWGWDASKPIVGCNLATSPDGFTNVHVMSDLVTPDSLPIKVTLAANSSMRVVAPLLAANILRTAVLTNAVTAQNRAAPLGGTRLTVRDNTLATWAIAEAPNRRVRMLNGPAIGGTFQPQTDTVATPGEVQCTPCQTTDEASFSTQPTTVTPAVGNTYVVEKLVVVNLGACDIAQELNPTFGGFEAFFNVVNCNLPNTGQQFWTPLTASAGVAGVFFNFYQCTYERNMDLSRCGAIFIACYGTNNGPGGIVQIGSAGGSGYNPSFNGGGANMLGGGVLAFFFNSILVDVVFDGDFCVNRVVAMSSVGAPVRNCASWNAVGGGGINAAGHGFQVGVGGGAASTFFGIRGITMFKGTVWGNQNGGAGMQLGSSCQGVGPPQNITGVQGDFKLGNKLVGWWFNDATAAYNPIGGSVATTWANLTAAEGAAGFGGNAHELDSNSHFVAADTTA